MPNNKLLTQQADQLFARGVAAARGGQKTVAVSLLRQTVKLNPQHEQAWLWLSGVVEKPEDVAFCLRAVLNINPANERAQRGLLWIEQHGTLPSTAAAPSAILITPVSAEPWWRAWRSTQQTRLWIFRMLLLIPIILLGSTLAVRYLIGSTPLPTFTAARDYLQQTVVAITPTPPPPTTTPVVTPTPPPRTALVAYYEAVQAQRHTLQSATETYRTTTNGGRTTVERVAATKQLRDQVQRSHDLLATLPPPADVSAAHQLYVDGLSKELEALNLLLDFYGSYNTALTNRAALSMADARTKIASATATWDAFALQQGIDLPAAGAESAVQITP